MDTTLRKRIQNHYQKMSSNHKLIAGYLLENYDQAAFMTAQQLGETLGVSESTVIRFATSLEYDGYPQLQKDLQCMVKNKISTVERLHLSLESKQRNILERVFNTDINNIRRTMEEINPQDFKKAVNEIIEARSIYIISLRSATSLGQFLHFYLNLILKNCRVVSGMSVFFEELVAIGPEDLAIGISFPRYSRQTIEGLKYAREKGARTIAITDSVTSPLAEHAHYVLTAHSAMTSFIDSFVAPLSVINALIIAVGTQESEKTAQALSMLEEIWDTFKIYYTGNGD
ncbi:MAG: MurR/RpiR family transcriptional regulator [Peptococcaceae bacterium]|jgi:DNA-binding MurR/RpiR family transcriptional regulator|nr:MurR/RpiR family transcriptional regulator [Peptococcaceae bacterium]MDH7525611.1 MurR/RpiR family transcriptional regulator [Peptococcaceae bacterium]